MWEGQSSMGSGFLKTFSEVHVLKQHFIAEVVLLNRVWEPEGCHKTNPWTEDFNLKPINKSHSVEEGDCGIYPKWKGKDGPLTFEASLWRERLSFPCPLQASTCDRNGTSHSSGFAVNQQPWLKGGWSTWPEETSKADTSVVQTSSVLQTWEIIRHWMGFLKCNWIVNQQFKHYRRQIDWLDILLV